MKCGVLVILALSVECNGKFSGLLVALILKISPSMFMLSGTAVPSFAVLNCSYSR